MWTLRCPKLEDTRELGRALAEVATEPVRVALSGDMGAGKTSFAQGVGDGLGVFEPVVSPTFVLVSEYRAWVPLLHADVWRLTEPELAEIGLEETIEGWSGVALVEWADRFPTILPHDHLRVQITIGDDEVRVIAVSATGPAHDAVLARWREAWDARS